MKVWTKVHIKDKNKQVELISKAFTNYLYTYGPILNIFRKYGVSLEDKKALDKYKPTTEKGKYILSRRKQGVSIQDLTQELNVSRQTIYNLLKK